jgi:hypothetical protein
MRERRVVVGHEGAGCSSGRVVVVRRSSSLGVGWSWEVVKGEGVGCGVGWLSLSWLSWLSWLLAGWLWLLGSKGGCGWSWLSECKGGCGVVVREHSWGRSWWSSVVRRSP